MLISREKKKYWCLEEMNFFKYKSFNKTTKKSFTKKNYKKVYKWISLDIKRGQFHGACDLDVIIKILSQISLSINRFLIIPQTLENQGRLNGRAIDAVA